MPTQIPELADGVTYMKMFNEAIEARTPGANPQFTDDQIQGTIENRILTFIQITIGMILFLKMSRLIRLRT